MTLIKKFGFGAVAAALFAAMAMAMLVNTAYADVDDLATSADVVEAGTNVTLTATLDDPPADGDSITFRVLGSSDGEGALGDAEEQTFVCDVVDDGAGADGNAGDPGDCNDGEAEVNLDGTGDEEVFTITLSTEVAGDLDLSASHAGAASLAVVTVIGEAAGDASSLEISAPASVASTDDDENVEIVVTVLDEDGEPVEGVGVGLDVTGGTPDPAGDEAATSDEDGEATFEIDVDDDVDEVEIIAYTDTGNVADDLFSSVTIPTGGAADAINVTAPETLGVGESVELVINVLDEDGDAIADADGAVDVEASAGFILGEPADVEDGEATVTFIAPNSEQTVQIVAESGSATTTVEIVIGAGAPDPGEPGDGTFEGDIATTGTSTVTFGGGTVAELEAAATAAGATSVVVFVGGEAVVLIPGAPAFVNAQFNASFPAGIEAGQIVLITIA